MGEKIYRNELKYIISDIEEAILTNRLSSLMKKDSHTNGEGFYTIKSLYFDNYDNEMLYDNENGVDPRGKYRIRCYNNDFNHLFLECKHKERGKVYKESCRISQEQCNGFIEGKNNEIVTSNIPLVRSLALLCMQNGFHPVVIVEYERIPYIYKAGNVRVTIDKKLRSSSSIDSFLEVGKSSRPVMKMGTSILEVKWDNLIPDFIYSTCQLDNLFTTAFSKYAICRRLHA